MFGEEGGGARSDTSGGAAAAPGRLVSRHLAPALLLRERTHRASEPWLLKVLFDVCVCGNCLRVLWGRACEEAGGAGGGLQILRVLGQRKRPRASYVREKRARGRAPCHTPASPALSPPRSRSAFQDTFEAPIQRAEREPLAGARKSRRRLLQHSIGACVRLRLSGCEVSGAPLVAVFQC